MPEIKERPILFSAPMVRAILEGRKTVTRRAVKGSGLNFLANFTPEYVALPENHFCPYGKPGDRLWVRETWWQAGDWQATYPEDDTGAWFGSQRVVYSADGTPPNEPNTSYPNGLRNGAYSAAAPNKIWRHRPSIHMNRWASRILLEITAVCVERLHGISEAQALAEGIYSDPVVNGMYTADGDNYTSKQDGPSRAFADLWKSTGGDWEANPWVWVVEFKRVTT
ncbi:hypothetical protein [Pseudomonas sp. F1002]|uniref:hypothetical protein n=1 Tax=Pseudomonas sp. F1002 TaxID=2738821 RepID=UPI0015A40DD5|nr:hypothetical protein [Pseudomonas sp. F1002]NWB63810.1 hypothetical protein [Pseudomonas sp. F1002]